MKLFKATSATLAVISTFAMLSPARAAQDEQLAQANGSTAAREPVYPSGAMTGGTTGPMTGATGGTMSGATTGTMNGGTTGAMNGGAPGTLSGPTTGAMTGTTTGGTLGTTTGAMRTRSADRNFVTQATEANVKEITLSKIALERSQNGNIRSFAQKMIDDHTKAGQSLSAIVANQNLAGPTQDQMADRAAADATGLAKMSGDAFDRKFASMMVSDHLAAIELFQKEATHGDDAKLKDYADDTLPVLRRHLVLAHALDPQSARNGGAAMAAPMATPMAANEGSATMNGSNGTPQDRAGSKDAMGDVDKALATLQKMQQDPDVRSMLARASGVFIVPDYGHAAWGVGAQGGSGVLMVKHNGKWSGPGFYNFGGLSFGWQAGAAAGQVAMLLMDRKAVSSFAQGNKFSLNSDAGLTVVDASASAHGDIGRGDVVMWSDTKGALANLSLGVTDVNYDADETAAYYGKPVSAANVVNANLSYAKPNRLAAALTK